MERLRRILILSVSTCAPWIAGADNALENFRTRTSEEIRKTREAEARKHVNWVDAQLNPNKKSEEVEKAMKLARFKSRLRKTGAGGRLGNLLNDPAFEERLLELLERAKTEGININDLIRGDEELRAQLQAEGLLDKDGNLSSAQLEAEFRLALQNTLEEEGYTFANGSYMPIPPSGGGGGAGGGNAGAGSGKGKGTGAGASPADPKNPSAPMNPRMADDVVSNDPETAGASITLPALPTTQVAGNPEDFAPPADTQPSGFNPRPSNTAAGNYSGGGSPSGRQAGLGGGGGGSGPSISAPPEVAQNPGQQGGNQGGDNSGAGANGGGGQESGPHADTSGTGNGVGSKGLGGRHLTSLGSTSRGAAQAAAKPQATTTIPTATKNAAASLIEMPHLQEYLRRYENMPGNHSKEIAAIKEQIAMNEQAIFKKYPNLKGAPIDAKAVCENLGRELKEKEEEANKNREKDGALKWLYSAINEAGASQEKLIRARLHLELDRLDIAKTHPAELLTKLRALQTDRKYRAFYGSLNPQLATGSLKQQKVGKPQLRQSALVNSILNDFRAKESALRDPLDCPQLRKYIPQIINEGLAQAVHCPKQAEASVEFITRLTDQKCQEVRTAMSFWSCTSNALLANRVSLAKRTLHPPKTQCSVSAKLILGPFIQKNPWENDYAKESTGTSADGDHSKQ